MTTLSNSYGGLAKMCSCYAILSQTQAMKCRTKYYRAYEQHGCIAIRGTTEHMSNIALLWLQFLLAFTLTYVGSAATCWHFYHLHTNRGTALCSCRSLVMQEITAGNDGAHSYSRFHLNLNMLDSKRKLNGLNSTMH